MTQEDKDLLLKDLCARLPYGVWIERKLKRCKFGAKCMLNAHDISAIEREQYEFCKPYLFPFSSMTEEQKRELTNLVEETAFQIIHSEDGNPQPHIAMDWYNKNHFDYRGLIPMGLANDATDKNIY